MKISRAKEIIQEGYEKYLETDNERYIEDKQVIDAIYCLAEFSYKMIKKTYIHADRVKDDLTQEMVIIAYKSLQNCSFVFGCIQNFMQKSGINYLLRSELKYIDSGNTFVPYSTSEAIELMEMLSREKANEFDKFIHFLSLIRHIRNLAEAKLQENMGTADSQYLLFPLLLSVFRMDDRLFKNVPYRTKFILRKISYELNEELVNVRGTSS